MGRAKDIRYFNNRYMGSLDDITCNQLEQIIELDSNNGCFSDLRHMIYNLPEQMVNQIIYEYEQYGEIVSELDRPYGTLEDMQTLGTAFAFIAKKCLLGDSVGLGKTSQMAGLCRMLKNTYRAENKPFKYLFLTEVTLLDEARSKMIQFTGEYAHILKGDKVNCGRFASKFPSGYGLKDGVIGAHSLLNQGVFIEWLESCRTSGNGFPFDLLIVDESKVLGGGKSGIVKNAEMVIKYFERVVFLNATPFGTNLSTFYNQLNLLDDRLLPVKTNFDKEYVIMDYRGMYPRPSGKYKNSEQFQRNVGYRYFARTRREKGAVQESCTNTIELSELSGVQKELLQKTSIPRLVYDCPNVVDPSIEFNVENVPKLGSLLRVLRTKCADEKSILVFVYYRKAQDEISKQLTKYGFTNKVLCGETKAEERAEITKGFKNNDFRVLITNVQRGLDIDYCNYCIFYSYDADPSNMRQFEGRITRSFNIIDKHIILLCSEGKEYKRLTTVIKERAEASSMFAKADLSCVLDLLLGGENE